MIEVLGCEQVLLHTIQYEIPTTETVREKRYWKFQKVRAFVWIFFMILSFAIPYVIGPFVRGDLSLGLAAILAWFCVALLFCYILEKIPGRETRVYISPEQYGEVIRWEIKKAVAARSVKWPESTLHGVGEWKRWNDLLRNKTEEIINLFVIPHEGCNDHLFKSLARATDEIEKGFQSLAKSHRATTKLSLDFQQIFLSEKRIVYDLSLKQEHC
jgi:hypothetical protein